MITRKDIKIKHGFDEHGNRVMLATFQHQESITFDKHLPRIGDMEDHAEKVLLEKMRRKLYDQIMEEGRQATIAALERGRGIPMLSYGARDEIHDIFRPFTEAGKEILENEK